MLHANYRPVSLLPVVSKLLDQAFLNNIYDQISSLISSSQNGYLPGRSTTTQLPGAFQGISNSMDKGTQTDVIHFRIFKSF